MQPEFDWMNVTNVKIEPKYLTPNEVELGRLLYYILTNHSKFGIIEKHLPIKYKDTDDFLSVIIEGYNNGMSNEQLQVLLLVLLQEDIKFFREKNETTNFDSKKEEIKAEKDIYDKAGI